MDNLFFSNSNLNFQILNIGLTKEQMDSAIPFDFKGKDVFVQFYLVHDGVYFPDGAVIRTNQFKNVKDNEYDELEVEFIYSIEHLTKMREAIKKRSEEAKKFAETHIPFARDAAGNEYFIESYTGMIKYISWEYGLEEGLIDVVESFKEFCLATEPLD